MYTELSILALFVFAYSLVVARVERAAASGPIVFVLVGLILGPFGFGWLDDDSAAMDIRVLADLTLALFLFVDAAGADTKTLRRQYQIPSRMLAIGLPGAMLLGTGVGILLFDSLGLLGAAILGTALAATDAALGKGVITNKMVPAPIREGLNTESGLNDGLCVPVLLVLITLANGGPESEGNGASLALTLVLKEIGIGLLVGVGMAAIALWLIRKSAALGWMNETWTQITVLALAVVLFAAAQSLEGSGYIAAYSGGLFFGFRMKEEIHKDVLTTEGIGEMFALMTWLLFGAVIIGRSVPYLEWSMLVYAVLSLTIVRMLPIYLSLWRSGLDHSSKLFLGWFGPRGLASIVFAVIIADEQVPGYQFISVTILLTVFFSLIVHGVTANPFARRLAAVKRET